MSVDSLFAHEIPQPLDDSGSYSCSNNPNCEWGNDCDGNHNIAMIQQHSRLFIQLWRQIVKKKIKKEEVVEEGGDVSVDGAQEADGLLGDGVSVDDGPDNGVHGGGLFGYGVPDDEVAKDSYGSDCDSFNG